VEIGPPTAETAEPSIWVAVALNRPEVTLGATGGSVLLSAPEGGGLAELPAGGEAVLSQIGGGMRATTGDVGTRTVASYAAKPADTGGFVRVNGRDYRGEIRVTATPTGLLAVNLVDLEAYVAGVVNAEMGRRPPGDSAAVLAQAVISRTVGLKSLGRHRVRGYDLVSTIADQAYGGVASETAMGWAAVRATRGEAVTWGGNLIEAFFHSTCGGRTAAVEEAFSGSPQPYLRSVSDRSPRGETYCAISPRFRWREEWTGAALGRSLQLYGSPAIPSGGAGVEPLDLQIGTRSPSGRVTELMLVTAGRVVPISGQQLIRQALRGADGGWLRSNQFSIQVSRSGGRLVRVVADGAGNGHGVGMCQWGAVGRARAGSSYRDILTAYFPGTEISRFY
jgi:stage II sporulation protein D